MSKNLKDLEKLSSKELEELLAEKRKKERMEYEARRLQYEKDRDELVKNLIAVAEQISKLIATFKIEAVNNLTKFKERALEYGDIRSNSKGGFSLRTSDGKMKVVFQRDTRSEYDERADLAEELLREFLGDMVKKRDQQAYEIITGLLQRGQKGDFNPAAISALIKMEDKYSDPRWLKAMKLFKESFNTRLIAYGVSFYKQDNLGKDKPIILSFSALPADQIENESNKEHNEIVKINLKAD